MWCIHSPENTEYFNTSNQLKVSHGRISYTGKHFSRATASDNQNAVTVWATMFKNSITKSFDRLK